MYIFLSFYLQASYYHILGLQCQIINYADFIPCSFLGGYDKRLKENVDYLEELKRLAVTEGVSGQVKFVTSCSTSERNELLSNCLCVLYTPKVSF